MFNTPEAGLIKVRFTSLEIGLAVHPYTCFGPVTCMRTVGTNWATLGLPWVNMPPTIKTIKDMIGLVDKCSFSQVVPAAASWIIKMKWKDFVTEVTCMLLQIIKRTILKEDCCYNISIYLLIIPLFLTVSFHNHILTYRTTFYEGIMLSELISSNNSVTWVLQRTIQIERTPLVGEISANFRG
jgi:hypothetical protein